MTTTKAQTAKHTPGPWSAAFETVGPDNPVPQWAVFSATDLATILRSDSLNEADAHLIASAPTLLAERDRLKEINAELLAALKIVCEASQLAVSALDSEDPGADSMMQKFWRSLEPARAAIARATGDA